ncbi:MAG: DinB family protein [Longimicrobiales bacterium]
MSRRALLALAVLSLTAAPLAAQNVKATLLNDFERQRANVLGMVDAMPDAGLRSAPTEGVRDFAQQIEHVAAGNVSIVRSGVDQPVTLDGFDAEVYLNSKTELKRFVNAAYDAVVEMIDATPESAMGGTTTLFGRAEVQRWELIKTAYEHGVWTLGATVPYLRMQGSAPPGYNLIPSR